MAGIAEWAAGQAGALPGLTPWLFGLALVVSAVGFYRLVYFISIGYAFSIVGMAVAAVVALAGHLNVFSALQCAALIAWGLRLGVYLVQREARPAYRRQAADNQQYDQGMTWGKKLPIWLSVSLLYVLMFSPALFGLAGPAAQTPAAGLARVAGAFLMLAGLALETIADRQKAAAKAAQPDTFCQTGLYSWVRCPNYLGEITFWLGNWMLGLPAYTAAVRWVVSGVGLICIVLIMLGSTKRLERSQGVRYGHLPAYQRYIRTVPVLIPWTPIYTLQGLRVYLE